MSLRAVFFDLDGTLLDTAGDLGNALNKLLVAEGKQPLPLGDIRCVVSDGANALLKLGFDVTPNDNEWNTLREKLLDFYLDDIASATEPFKGIYELIQELTNNNIGWGIVTNKPVTYTEPLMTFFEFASPPLATICPEHVVERKPAAEALLLACSHAKVDVSEVVYVGDHERDILCGINAGVATIAVGYGYIPEHNSHKSWNATHTVNHANEIWPVLKQYL